MQAMTRTGVHGCCVLVLEGGGLEVDAVGKLICQTFTSLTVPIWLVPLGVTRITVFRSRFLDVKIHYINGGRIGNSSFY